MGRVLTRTHLVLIAAGGSAGLMLTALAFQHWGGLAPCKLCIWQRYPHVAAIAIAPLALVLGQRWLLLAGAAALLATAGIGAYHVGVEQGWWEGPSTCSSTPIGGLSADALLDQIMNAPLVRCDEIAWSLLGVSMAGWNALVSVTLALLWIEAFRRA
jgi:disulfide bond formation protein DsbB